jgi:hypothetical protein
MQHMWAVAAVLFILPVLASAQTAAGTASLDLGKAGLKAAIQAPQGAAATEEFASVFVRNPPSFATEINQKEVATFRKDVVSNDIQKLLRGRETEHVHEGGRGGDAGRLPVTEG